MSTLALASGTRGILRYSRWDALLLALAGLQAVVFSTVTAAPILALGLWWKGVKEKL